MSHLVIISTNGNEDLSKKQRRRQKNVSHFSNSVAEETEKETQIMIIISSVQEAESRRKLCS